MRESKKVWSAPKLSAFDTPEQVWAHFSPKAKDEELPALVELVNEMRRTRETRDARQTQGRRSA